MSTLVATANEVTSWIGLALLVVAASVEDIGGADERELAVRIRNGDHAAFKSCFEAHHDTVYRYLRGRGLSPEVASDAVQQAFIVLWEKRSTIRTGTSLRAFVFQIAYRRALNDLRSQRGVEIDDALGDAAAGGEQAQDLLLVRDYFDRAIDALPEKRRMVFELCFVHGYTYKEAAAVLEVSVKTIENQMGHALKAMRRAFADFRESGAR